MWHGLLGTFHPGPHTFPKMLAQNSPRGHPSSQGETGNTFVQVRRTSHQIRSKILEGNCVLCGWESNLLSFENDGLLLRSFHSQRSESFFSWVYNSFHLIHSLMPKITFFEISMGIKNLPILNQKIRIFFIAFLQGKSLSSRKLKAVGSLIEPWFLFSLVWSIGATCDGDSRKKFDQFLREKIKTEKVN